MATLVFTALGTAIGGPLGGALGSLIGNQLDRTIAGSSGRQGPRLKELAVTTSSYGTAVPRHYGTMRSAGSIIWSTDLMETTEKGKGGKGKPATTAYSYSVSFAVALASRPIARLGRVWADGNLLVGAKGDLKVGGQLRVYSGRGDQPPDPIIVAEKGASCPGFRDLAYCVFESLQLAEFGNRIPSLTFEIIADDGEVSLTSMVEQVSDVVEATRPLESLTGFSNDGGPLARTLATIDQVYPLALNAAGKRLAIRAADDLPADPPMLPEPAIDAGAGSFGAATGATRRRQPDMQDIPEGLRYYDISRDYQAGMQRPQGRARPGRQRIIEFPGALEATAARKLASAAAERAGWSRETLTWRTAELDPSIGPGSVVRVPGNTGLWRVEGWEWRDCGVELDLRRLPRSTKRRIVADAGEPLPASDLVATPTHLAAFELPWNGTGSSETRQVYVAATSRSRGWKGAALYREDGGNLVPIGSTGSRRSVLGSTLDAVLPSAALVLERSASVEVQLVSEDFVLTSAPLASLANGANRALIGDEIVQFATAESLGDARWRLRGLLRGRGGTEAAALTGHAVEASFILLDDTLVTVDPAQLGAAREVTVAAIGLADQEPVFAQLANPGLSLRPLSPVHPRTTRNPGRGLIVEWTRRARGAWTWDDLLPTPLVEPTESYLVGLGNVDQPVARWEVSQPRLQIAHDQLASLSATHRGKPLWVRQVGLNGLSDALLLTTLA
jgi:hypothetical protein